MGLPEQIALQGTMSSKHGGLHQFDLYRGCVHSCVQPSQCLAAAGDSRACVWPLPPELSSVMQAADELQQYMTELVLQKGDLLFSQVTCTILPSHTWV